MKSLKRCRWKCGRMTDRICGICLDCCNARDERDRQIDSDLASYIPPEQRPGHRLLQGQHQGKAERWPNGLTR